MREGEGGREGDEGEGGREMREGEGGREMREGGKMCNVGNVVGPR